jgi:hypothetical protein
VIIMFMCFFEKGHSHPFKGQQTFQHQWKWTEKINDSNY